MKVVFAGGGTAGHLNPLLVMAEHVKMAGGEVAVVGTGAPLERKLLDLAGLELMQIARAPFPRSLSRQTLGFPFKFVRALGQCCRVLRSFAPDVVVGFGSYAATPLYLAARMAKIPIVIHEGNVRPGMANKLGARWATYVATTFPHTPLRKAQRIGLPLRAQIRELAHARREGLCDQRAARVKLGLDPVRPVVLVTGGSQGALRINETIAAAAADIVATGAQILHQTGAGKLIKDPIAHHHVCEYLDDMVTAYAAADFHIGRAGAGTVCEVAALGLAAVYVPLGHGNGEQALNAQTTVGAGGGILVADTDFTPAWVRARLCALLCDGARLQEMATAATSVGILDAHIQLGTMMVEAAQ